MKRDTAKNFRVQREAIDRQREEDGADGQGGYAEGGS